MEPTKTKREMVEWMANNTQDDGHSSHFISKPGTRFGYDILWGVISQEEAEEFVLGLYPELREDVRELCSL
jgi:hypothetical protein